MENDVKLLRSALRSENISYIPNFATIMQALKLSNDDMSSETVHIPTRFFKFLISLILLSQGFDEDAYRKANPDIDQAIRSGKIESAWVHFVFTGYFEHRDTEQYEIDETWYKKRYVDIAIAVRKGQLKAKDHYVQTGRHEGRAASAADERLKSIWAAALTR